MDGEHITNLRFANDVDLFHKKKNKWKKNTFKQSDHRKSESGLCIFLFVDLFIFRNNISEIIYGDYGLCDVFLLFFACCVYISRHYLISSHEIFQSFTI